MAKTFITKVSFVQGVGVNKKTMPAGTEASAKALGFDADDVARYLDLGHIAEKGRGPKVKTDGESGEVAALKATVETLQAGNAALVEELAEAKAETAALMSEQDQNKAAE